MKTKIYEPNSALADFIKCYWTLESSLENTPKRNTIIPDGTMKLIFHYGDLYWHHPKDGKSFLQPRCFLIGQLTKPYVVEPVGETGTFVIRFNSNGFSPFTDIPIKEMENKPISLKKLFGDKGEKLEYDILNANNTDERIKIAETFLFALLKSKEVKDRIVNATIEAITKYKGQLSVNELSDRASLSRRILARKFSSNIGLSPKQLSKIVRLQASLKSLLENENSNLIDLTYENEYFDQSHFIKDFKEFTGITPKEFYGEELKMSLIFDAKK
ncbi:helix-turn-helix transcriptional regulator [Maribacter sp.]|uniref:helix-turn-helix transcriptional regulator n=1 Tax=Maribacter sp. TaxID=1897614 RepID=UPI0025BAB971|nr:helix-turn-helix transcriptional regulator [Maribacter sp.]